MKSDLIEVTLDTELLNSAQEVLSEMGLTVEQACELFISNVTADNIGHWLGTDYLNSKESA